MLTPSVLCVASLVIVLGYSSVNTDMEDIVEEFAKNDTTPFNPFGSERFYLLKSGMWIRVFFAWVQAFADPNTDEMRGETPCAGFI